MRKLRMAVLGGGASLLLAGAAMAASNDMHVMKVALPDGSVAQISYHGDVAPKVRVSGGPGVAMPVEPIALFDMTPFAEMDRMAAMMDRQADVAMRQMAAMQRDAAAGRAPQRLLTAGGKAMPGVVSYSYVSTTTSEGGCTRTVEWRSDGTSPQPKMTKTSAGSCGGAHDGAAARPVQTAAPAPAAAPAPKTRV